MRESCKNIIYFIIFATIIVTFSGCKKDSKKDEVQDIFENVTIMEIMHVSLMDTFTLSGEVFAAKDIVLASELGGPVEWVGAQEGDMVSENEVIAKINLKSLMAALDQAQAQYELAELTHRRQKQLFEKKLISPGQMDKHNAGLKVAEANLESARIQHKKGQINSPISGRLDKLDLDVGEILLPGQVFCRIINTVEVEVHVALPEKDVSDVKKGDEVFVEIMSKSDKVYRGKVAFLALATENVSKTYLCKILMENGSNVFRPGMIVNVTFNRIPQPDSIVVPQTAVLTKEGRKWVYLADGNIAREREVRTGAVVNDEVEITEGLLPGDFIITTGQFSIIDGDRINHVKSTPNSGEKTSSENN